MNTIIETNYCTGQLDEDSAGIDSRASTTIIRYNKVVGCKGAGVRLGGPKVGNDQYGIACQVSGKHLCCSFWWREFVHIWLGFGLFGVCIIIWGGMLWVVLVAVAGGGDGGLPKTLATFDRTMRSARCLNFHDHCPLSLCNDFGTNPIVCAPNTR